MFLHLLNFSRQLHWPPCVPDGTYLRGINLERCDHARALRLQARQPRRTAQITHAKTGRPVRLKPLPGREAALNMVDRCPWRQRCTVARVATLRTLWLPAAGVPLLYFGHEHDLAALLGQ